MNKTRKAVWAWCLYDFANSPFTTLVVTFIYATFFTQVIASDEIRGTELWSRAVTLTAVIVALLSPIMGAFADRGGFRKRILLATTAICILVTLLMTTAAPGEVVKALALFVIANIAYEVGMVFYNAFLPDVAPPAKIGRISGMGWGMGYVGGLLALVIAFVGFVQPDQPWFGLTRENGINVRATCVLVALWFGVFSLPLFLWIKEERALQTEVGLVRMLGSSFAQLSRTFHEIRRYRQVVIFLLARLLYNDGLITVFAFGGIYAAGTFKFTIEEILVFGIVLNLAAGLGAFTMGYLDDRLGGRRTIEISLGGLSVATLIAVLAPEKWMFWCAGIMVGLFAGPNQSASRSLMGRFVPPDKENEFFGFFAFSGKATAFLGPFLLGRFTGLFNSQRAGISAVLILLVAGWVVLRMVDEQAGVVQANRDPARQS